MAEVVEEVEEEEEQVEGVEMVPGCPEVQGDGWLSGRLVVSGGGQWWAVVWGRHDRRCR